MSSQTQTLTIFFSTEICFQADHEKLLRRNFSWRKPFCSGRCWVTDSVIFLRWEEDLTSFWWVLDVGGPPFGTAKVMTTALFYVGCELSLFLIMWMLVFLWDWELLRRDTCCDLLLNCCDHKQAGWKKVVTKSWLCTETEGELSSQVSTGTKTTGKKDAPIIPRPAHWVEYYLCGW